MSARDGAARRRARALVISGLTLTQSALAAEPFDPAEGRGNRVAVEGVSYLGSAAVGVVAGAALGCALDSFSTPRRHGFGCLGPAVVGGVVTAAVAAPLGTWGAGRLMGANGGLGWTYLGQLSGLALAVPLAMALDELDAPGLLIGVTVIALPLTATVLGFELSTERVERRSDGQGAALGAMSAPGLSWGGRF